MEWLRREVLDVDVDEAEVIVTEAALAFSGPVCGSFWPAVQALGLEDVPDTVTVEVRQEMADDEGEVVEREVGGTPQAADDGALLLSGLPRQLVRASGTVEAVCYATLAPLAHSFGADAVTLGYNAAGLAGTGGGDLGAGGGGDAGVRVGAVAKVVEIDWWRSLWFVQRTISGVSAPVETTPWKTLGPVENWGFPRLRRS